MQFSSSLRAASLGICLAICGMPAAAETFRASTFNAANSPNASLLEDFAKYVKEGTGGAVDFEIFTGGSLLPGEGTLVGLQTGVAQIANINASQIPSDMPYDNVISDLGFVADDQMALAFATTELRFFNEQIQKEIEANDLVYGTGFTIGIWNIICRDEVKSLADVKGKRMRGTGGAQIEFIGHIGATAVSVPPTEIYTGLQRGSLDCTAGSPEFLTVFWRLSEVAKSVYLIPLGSLPTGGYYLNKQFWQDRTPEERRVILDSLSRATAKSLVEWSGLIDDAFAVARKENISLVTPTEQDMGALHAYTDNFVATLPQVSVAKRGIDDPTLLITDMVGLIEKWKKLLSGIDTKNVDEVAALLSREIFDKVDVKTYGLD